MMWVPDEPEPRLQDEARDEHMRAWREYGVPRLPTVPFRRKKTLVYAGGLLVVIYGLLRFNLLSPVLGVAVLAVAGVAVLVVREPENRRYYEAQVEEWRRLYPGCPFAPPRRATPEWKVVAAIVAMSLVLCGLLYLALAAAASALQGMKWSNK